MGDDFDSTLALLSSDMPNCTLHVPNYPRPGVDSDEEEIFFGREKSEKELFGKNASVARRRETLKLGTAKTSCKDHRIDCTLNDSIPEEDEECDKENKENIMGIPTFTKSFDTPKKSPPKSIKTSAVLTKEWVENSPLKIQSDPDTRFPRLGELKNDEQDCDDSRSSIVDIGNDQVFDSSIFAENDERNLSQLSEKICKKWRTKLTDDKPTAKNGKKQKIKKQFDDTFFLLNDMDSHDMSDEEHEVVSTAYDKVKRNLDFDVKKHKKDQSGKTEIDVDNAILRQEEIEAAVDVDKAIQRQEEIETAVDVDRAIEDDCKQKEGAEKDDRSNSFHSDCLGDMSVQSGYSNRRSSTCSTCSDWFNTTREEMILYEKFGEDYDLVVEKMSREDKTKLKEEISNSIPKDVLELLGSEIVHHAGEEKELLENIQEEDEKHRIEDNDQINSSKCSVTRVDETPDVSQLSEKIVRAARYNDDKTALDRKVPPVPLPRTLTPQKADPEITFKEQRAPKFESNINIEKTSNIITEKTSNINIEKTCNINVPKSPTTSKYESNINVEKTQVLKSIFNVPKTPSRSKEEPNPFVEKSSKSDSNINAPKSSSTEKLELNTNVEETSNSKSNINVDKAPLSPKLVSNINVMKTSKLESNINVPTTPSQSRIKENLFVTPSKEPLEKQQSLSSKKGPMKSAKPEGTYLTPAKSEIPRRVPFKSPAMTKSPSYLRPTSASQQRISPKKNANSPSPAPQSHFCSRGNCCSASPFMQPWTPTSKNKNFPLNQIDMAKIVSPVAQYIHTSNVPNLMRRVNPTKCPEDEILYIQENDDNDNVDQLDSKTPRKKVFKPLPESQYSCSKVALQKELPNDPPPKELTKKFMTTNTTQAVVIRRLGHKRVPQQEIENWASASPNNRQGLEKGTVFIKSDNREEDLFDQTSMEMSIRERKEITKMVPTISRKNLL